MVEVFFHFLWFFSEGTITGSTIKQFQVSVFLLFVYCGPGNILFSLIILLVICFICFFPAMC